jgi:hypothetical protein
MLFGSVIADIEYRLEKYLNSVAFISERETAVGRTGVGIDTNERLGTRGWGGYSSDSESRNLPNDKSLLGLSEEEDY